MARISNIESVRIQLNIGHIECRKVWALDNQYKLKGNSLKAFETCLNTICNFDKYKEGKLSYYHIKEIYDEALPREHKNKIALIGNKNKLDKICFEEGSDVLFVSALLLNKVDYFNHRGDNGYYSISSWVRMCGLKSENEKVQNRIRNLVEYSINKLSKLGFISVNIQYMECRNGIHSYITKDDFQEYRDKSKLCFISVVNDDIRRRYRSYSQFHSLYKWSDKYLIEDRYWKAMNTDIEYVYRVYKIDIIFKPEFIEDKNYNKLLDTIWGSSEEYMIGGGITINERINEFLWRLESGQT